MKIKKQSKKIRKSVITVIVATVAVAMIGSYLIYSFYFGVDKTDNDYLRQGEDSEIDATPDTSNKDAVIEKDREQSDHPSQPEIDKSDNLKEVNVVLTSVSVGNGEVSVSGFVSNTIESEGTCTYIFTQGSRVIRKDSSILPGPSSTVCRTLNFSTAELVSGEWTVSLSYKSPFSTGESNNTIKVAI